MYTDRAFEGARASEAEAARLSVIAVAVTTLIAFGALVFVSRSLSSVRQLQSAAERLRAGDYRAAELPITDDEIGDLAREFEAMARAIGARDTRLRAQFEELEAAHRAIGVEHAARLRAERLAAAGELAGRITHEVRNPLSSISLNAEMLSEALSGVAAPDEAREALRIIGREVARLDALTEDYLGLARTARPESEWVPLSDLVAELAGSLRLEAARSGARIEIDNQLAHPAVTVPGTIRQALMNLARNALQFVTDRDVAVVRLTLQSSDHSVDIHVDDSGPGIPADDLDRIFEAFFSRRAGGTGLGLAISRRIVELEGGRLGATPTGPLGGARFSVALPSRA
jgi:signal transduction histidine kinase